MLVEISSIILLYGLVLGGGTGILKNHSSVSPELDSFFQCYFHTKLQMASSDACGSCSTNKGIGFLWILFNCVPCDFPVYLSLYIDTWVQNFSFVLSLLKHLFFDENKGEFWNSSVLLFRLIICINLYRVIGTLCVPTWPSFVVIFVSFLFYPCIL